MFVLLAANVGCDFLIYWKRWSAFLSVVCVSECVLDLALLLKLQYILHYGLLSASFYNSFFGLLRRSFFRFELFYPHID